ncbi:MAG: TetR/AcrR family transcriptional regulator [Lachnospiraceae bacterium]|nr:TetR/AcrR family transcriptional regulator [Lachnospiraceae bacterium]
MASFTKKAIKETFLQLLDEKPYSQITVKDIVETCGINRNSFYYHYADLPALVEEIIEDDILKLMSDSTSLSSLQESLSASLQFSKDHKRAVYHLYRSVNRERFEQYLMKNCEFVVSRYVDTLLKDVGASDNDRRLVINYFKYLCFGAVIEWLESGMKLNIENDFARICELMVDPALKNAGLSTLLSPNE